MSEANQSASGTEYSFENSVTIHGRFRHVFLTDALRSNPRISGKWFYVLPHALWERLIEVLGPSRFDADLLALEYEVASEADSLPSCVGFRDGHPILDTYIRPTPPLNLNQSLLPDYFARCAAAGYRFDELVSAVAERLLPLREPQQAYLGWLFTNPQFQQEFRELQEAHPSIFALDQIPPQLIALQAQLGSPPPGLLETAVDDLATRMAGAFCRKWRLAQLVGPNTLIPLSLQCPAPLPTLANAHAQSSGTTVFIPDIAPLPNRDVLRSLIEEAVRQTTAQASYLRDWFELVAADNQGRRSLHLYTDMYPLQHYLRILYSRHGENLGRSKQAIERVVGTYLELSESQLRNQLRLIVRRLGREWYRTPNAT